MNRTFTIPGVLCVSAVGLLFAFAGDATPEALIEAGHWKRARALLEERVKFAPNDPATAYLLAKVLATFGELAPALKLAEKAASLDNRNADYQYMLAEIHGEMAQRASVFKQLGLARTCRKEAETALALNPKHVDAMNFLVEYYRQAPGVVGGDKKKAEALAQEIAKLDPVRGYTLLWQLAREEKNKSKADEYQGLYTRALEAAPTSYVKQIAMANLQLASPSANLEIAERHAREALRLDPDRVPGYSALARIRAKQERWSDLDEILAEAESNIPDNLSPYVQAGLVIVTEGKEWKRAEGYFRKYLTQPAEPNAPKHSRVHYRLAQTLEKQNRKVEAVAELKTALRLEPDFEAAKKDLNRLR